MDQLTGAKPGGVHGPCHTPVIVHAALGLVDRPGAGEHARHLGTEADSGKTAERVLRTLGLLARQQFMLARDWQARQCMAAVNSRGVDAVQDLRKRRAAAHRMGDLRRQGLQQGGFALRRIAGFQNIVKSVHGVGPLI